MDKLVNIAVVMTCYNRKNKTLACLGKLKDQEGVNYTKIQVYLVDDGCTDGTGELVRKNFPEIIVLKGTGNLYWGGGMRLAFGEALNKDYAFYLWLNDDVMLYPTALSALIDTYTYIKDKKGVESILSGAICDPSTEKTTYGGSIKLKRWSPLSYQLADPSGKPEKCEVVNGNCVLIPGEIAKTVGNISKDFIHQGGDYDYSLRAKKNGFSCWISSGYVGTCPRNTLKGSVKDSSLSIRARTEGLSRPTSMISAEEWMLFIRRHGGTFWPIYWLRTLVRKTCPWLWVLLRSRRV